MGRVRTEERNQQEEEGPYGVGWCCKRMETTMGIQESQWRNKRLGYRSSRSSRYLIELTIFSILIVSYCCVLYGQKCVWNLHFWKIEIKIYIQVNLLNVKMKMRCEFQLPRLEHKLTKTRCLKRPEKLLRPTFQAKLLKQNFKYEFSSSFRDACLFCGGLRLVVVSLPSYIVL